MNRRLPSIIALILAAGVAGLLTGTASHAAQATLGCPGTVPTGAQLATEITVDVGTIPLGAYSLTVTYDPTVLTIASVAGGNSPEFAGAPTTNPGSFTSGRTNISAFQTSSLTGPTEVVSVTRVRFNVVGTITTTTSVGLTVGSLFDTNSSPIAHTATGCMVMVTGTTTTTSSTTTTIPGNTCPVGQGSWKNHPSAWPVRTLTLGRQTYSEQELLTVLRTPPGNRSGNDVSVILAHQLITAKLNIANGADPSAIAATVADADGLLAAFVDKLPYRVRSFSVLGHAMVNDAGLLDSYNSGRLTPNCVAEEDLRT